MKKIFIFAFAITLLSIIGITWIGYLPRPVTISQPIFEVMLKRHEVKLITVLSNKKTVELTLRDEVLENEQYRKILGENNTGPHFLFNITSSEDFESYYEGIEKDIPSEYRPDMKIESGPNYVNLICNYGFIAFLSLNLIFLYFIPSFVAHTRNHRQFNAIFLLNLLLGWTVLFWIAALIWSVIREK
jgi:hypothetical protein